MSKSIAVIGTLDTKGDEIKYVTNLVEKRGHKVILIDVSVVGEVPFDAVMSREQVAEAAGTSLEELIALDSEAKAMERMAQGAANIVKDLYASEKLDGCLAFGGTAGTSLALTVMGALPIGVPKLILSTIAFSHLIPEDAIKSDIMMLQWAAGLRGINSINRRVLDIAAGAIAGAAENFSKDIIIEKKVRVGISSMGVAPCPYAARWLQPGLEKRGYEPIFFHAVGGGRVLEQAIREGEIDIVLDLELAEIANEVAGGMASAGKHRLEAAGRMGIPQIVAMTFAAIMWATHKPLPRRFRGRFCREHNWLVSNLPTSIREKEKAAKLVAKKLNKATGPTAVVLPMGGPLPVFDDPEGAMVIKNILENNLNSKIKMVVIDGGPNAPQFTETVLRLLDEMTMRRS